MRTGIDLLRDTAYTLDQCCGCERPRCEVCGLRKEIATYLEIAAPTARPANDPAHAEAR